MLKESRGPVPASIPYNPAKGDGFMINVNSVDIRPGDEITVDVSAVLESGSFITASRHITADPKYPNTIFFGIGRTAYVLRADISLKRMSRFSAAEDDPEPTTN